MTNKTETNHLLVIGGGELGTHLFKKLVYDEGFNPDFFWGFVDDYKEIGTEIIEGKSVQFNSDHLLAMEDKSLVTLVPAIGYSKLAERLRLFQKLSASGFEFLSFVSEKSTIPKTAKLGRGVTVLSGVTLDTGVTVKDFSFLDIQVSVGEMSVISEGCFVANNSTICGNCLVEQNCFLGAASLITNNIVIGNNSIINAQSMVTWDVPAASQWVHSSKFKILPISGDDFD